MNLIYIVARLVRHFLPEGVTRALLRNNVLIKPGLETRVPAEAAARYQQVLAQFGKTLLGKHILVFGYGGRYAIGVELLRLGAEQVTLTDLFAPPDDRRNDHLLPGFEEYLERKEGKVIPKGDRLVLVHGDIKEISRTSSGPMYDTIVSASVFEHLSDVEDITSALNHLLKPNGCFIAFIDFRDHFFKYPFEMLTFPESTWKHWLNPTSHLNRLRLREYQRIIDPKFTQSNWKILEANIPEFLKIKDRILPEYLTGDDEQDAITQAMVFAVK